MTSILFAVTALNPREEIDQVPLLKRATWTPSASAIASAIVVTPERLMSSPVITEIAAGVAATGSGTPRRERDIEVHELFDGQPLEFSLSWLRFGNGRGGWSGQQCHRIRATSAVAKRLS